MPATETRNQGKSMFIKEVLNDNPYANHEVISERWEAAGMDGTISPTLVSRIRSRMGLAGNLGRGRGGKARKGRRRSERPAAPAASMDNGSTRGMGRGKRNNLLELEVEIDRLLMRVMEAGSLPEVEDALRKARRHLYAGMEARS